MKAFRLRGQDVVAKLERAEAEVLARLLDELEQLLEAPSTGTDADDPVLRRLLPEGHRGDPGMAADYREMTEATLRRGKADDLAAVRASLPERGGEVRLDPDQAAAWMRSTNDLRLALGTRIGVTEDTEPPDDPTTEEGRQLILYHWLTWVQGSLVDALAAGRARRR